MGGRGESKSNLRKGKNSHAKIKKIARIWRKKIKSHFFLSYLEGNFLFAFLSLISPYLSTVGYCSVRASYREKLGVLNAVELEDRFEKALPLLTRNMHIAHYHYPNLVYL